MALVRTLLIGAIAVLFCVPLFWMVGTSLKTPLEVFGRPFRWLPEVAQWKNYMEVWINAEVPMYRAFLNSVWIALFGIVGQLLVASIAAYAFAKINFKGKNIIFMLYMASMMIPAQVTIIPRFMLFKSVGLYNTLWSVILPHWFGVSAIFLLRQFYMGLPDELMEAAKIDGAGHPRIFSQIMMPLTKPALVSLVILSFISLWNEYLAPLIFLTRAKENYTISQVIRWYLLNAGAQYELVMTASCISLIPILIVFVAGQRHFIEGIASSGVKG
ncbi:MAG: carbohydrate ABC transporter permease [Lachnospiraceae bacterium]|nr:carbohydrate ABC transporter permease [Lachnospiraceae bacterium]